MTRAALTLTAGLLAAPAWANSVFTVDYLCDRDVSLSVAYVTDIPEEVAVMFVEGRLVAMTRTPAASGVLYEETGKPETGYRWFAKGDEALLGHGATEGTTILAGCKAEG